MNIYRKKNPPRQVSGANIMAVNKGDVLQWKYGGGTRWQTFGYWGNPYWTLAPAQEYTGQEFQYIVYNGSHAGAPSPFVGYMWIAGAPPGATPYELSPRDQIHFRGTSLPPDAVQPFSDWIETNYDDFISAVWWNNQLWVAGNTGCPFGDATFTGGRVVRVDALSHTVNVDLDMGAENWWMYYPALAVDGTGNVIVAGSASNWDNFVLLGVGWIATTNPTHLDGTQPIQLGLGTYNQQPNRRWGDYSAAVPDPSNPNNIWIAGMYAAPPNGGDWNWATWKAKVHLQ